MPQCCSVGAMQWRRAKGVEAGSEFHSVGLVSCNYLERLPDGALFTGGKRRQTVNLQHLNPKMMTILYPLRTLRW